MGNGVINGHINGTIKYISEKAKAIAAIVVSIGAIGSAGIYINTTYAKESDVQKIIKNQTSQIDIFEKSQRRAILFRLEYYDDRLRQLEQEKRIAKERLDDRTLSPTQRAFTRPPEDIQREIEDIRERRSILRREIIE